MVQLGQLLQPGRPKIALFADGSFHSGLSIGTWAYLVPDFGLQEVGSPEGGPGVENFEILAALEGLAAILRVDKTDRPVLVHGDSIFALLFLRLACEQASLPRTRAMNRLRVLYDRATELTSRRTVVLVKANRSVPEHDRCHSQAIRRLREETATPKLRNKILLRSVEQKMGVLFKQRDGLQRQIRVMDDELVSLHLRLQTLAACV